MTATSNPEKIPVQARRRIEQLESTVIELGGMVERLASQLAKRGVVVDFTVHSPLLTKVMKRSDLARPLSAAVGRRSLKRTAAAPDVGASESFPRGWDKAESVPPVAVPGTGGLSGAVKRGEAAKVQWVETGELVPAKGLAEAWGLTPQALGPAAKRGELFEVTVKAQRYYPREFIDLNRKDVGTVCKQMVGLDPSEQLIFWKRKHGALGGRTVAETLGNKNIGPQLVKVVQLAQAYAAQMHADAAAA
ncbi:MAG: hypothetical protein ACK4PH_23755 [Aquincola tertiaricarbonis]